MAGIKQIKGVQKPRAVKQVPIEEPQDTWLNELIERHLTGTMYPAKTNVFHPSAISNPCDRALWLAYHGQMVEMPLSATLHRIFENGNYLEQRVEHWFRDTRILLGREVPVRSNDPPISGRIDFLIKHSEHGVVPIELKSINTAGFGRLTKPKDEHQMQLQIYLNLGGYELGTVLYENKNDQRIKSFFVKRDVDQWDAILSRLFSIQAMSTRPSICTGANWCNCRNVPEVAVS